MSYHTMSVTLDFGSVHLKCECSATPEDNAFCRQQCAEHCGAEELPCYSYDSEGEIESEHETVDSGECGVCLFINDDDPAECGPIKGTFPLHDGMPIEVEWQGDYYRWKPCA